MPAEDIKPQPARPHDKDFDLDIGGDPNGPEGLANPYNSDIGTGEDLPGNNADTVDKSATDIDGDDDSQPDSDNPNDVGEDESLG